MFVRQFYKEEKVCKEVIQKLKEDCFFNFLLDDIKKGEVFPALRKNEIHFYYAGQRLCRFKSKEWREVFMEMKTPQTLQEYTDIKLACKKKGERNILTYMFKLYSPYYPNANQEVKLLDYEIGFPQLHEFGNCQIDLLFLYVPAKTLIFVEAKEADDYRINITTKDGETAQDLYSRLKVKKQIEKYKNNLQRSEIAGAYRECISVISEIFDINLPYDGLSIYPNPKLFVYGKPTENGKTCLMTLETVLGKNDYIFHQNPEELSVESIIKGV